HKACVRQYGPPVQTTAGNENSDEFGANPSGETRSTAVFKDGRRGERLRSDRQPGRPRRGCRGADAPDLHAAFIGGGGRRSADRGVSACELSDALSELRRIARRVLRQWHAM